MFVVIVGGGRTGTQLAKTLIQQDHTVHVIENRSDILSMIHHELPTEAIFQGNPLDPLILDQAGVKSADVLAAVTTRDEVNLAVCHFVRLKYNVPRTIARVNNPRDAWLFDKVFNVDVAVNQSAIMSHVIEEEMSMGDMMTLLKLRRGNYSLVTEKIPEGAKAVGMMLKDSDLPEHCVIAAIIRKGEVVVPRGISIFEKDDEVLAITDPEGAKQLSDLFDSPKTDNGDE
ncbi:MAG: TrkA family potassium uptake protein [Leptolinea sp.]|jgi:trk system potassium uptake protein TrkA|nr:TrkA family potassium uptake protein [Leptolinea sp.]